MAAPVEQLRLSDGRRLAYVQHGPPDGVPLVYCHGAPSARIEPELFDLPAVAGRLALRMIVPDRPGVGLSDFQPGRLVSHWPADVQALADHLGLSQFAILGYSGGGPYTLICAARMPDRLLDVTTVSGTGPFDVPGATDGINQDSLKFMRLSVTKPRLHRLVVGIMGLTARVAPGKMAAQAVKALPEPDAQVMAGAGKGALFAQMVAEAARKGFRGASLETALMVSPWDFDPAEIAIPVHLWHGEKDANAPLAMGRYLAERIPEARPTVVPGEAHLSLMANHAEVILRGIVDRARTRAAEPAR